MTAGKFSWTNEVWPVCEIGLGTFSTTEPTSWIDVTHYVHECELVRGREGFTERFQPGTASITFDNRNGWADFSDPALLNNLNLRPGRAIRVGVFGPWNLAGNIEPGNAVPVVRWLWRGFIDACKPSYDPVLHDIVTAECIDALGEVGKIKLVSAGPPGVGGDETVDVRVNRILNAAEWPAAKRTINGSTTQLLPTLLGTQAIDLLGQSADSAGGVVYGDNTGGITYKDRDWMLWPSGKAPDAVIGNIGAATAASDAYYVGPAPSRSVETPHTAADVITGDRVWTAKLRKNTTAANGVIAEETDPQSAFPPWSYRIAVRPAVGAADGLYITITQADGQMLTYPLSNRAQWQAIPAGVDFWISVSLDVDNGASGYTLTARLSFDGQTFSVFGTPAVGVGVFVGYTMLARSVIRIGGNGLSEAFNGRIYRVEMRRGLLPMISEDVHDAETVWQFNPTDWSPPVTILHDYLNTDLTGNGIDDNWVPYTGPGITPGVNESREVVDGRFQQVKAGTLPYQSIYGMALPSNMSGSPFNVTAIELRAAFSRQGFTGLAVQMVWLNVALTPVSTQWYPFPTPAVGGGGFGSMSAVQTFSTGLRPAPTDASALTFRFGCGGLNTPPVAGDKGEVQIYEIAVKQRSVTSNVYRNRTWTTDATFFDAVPAFDGDVCPSGWEINFDRSQLTTAVEIGRETPEITPQNYTLIAATSNPGNGQMALSSSDQAAATQIQIAKLNGGGTDISTFLRYVRQGATIRISDANDTNNKSRSYLVNGAPVELSTYWLYPVMWTDGETAVPNGGVSVILNVPNEEPTMIRDEAAIAAYGIEVFSRTDLLMTSTALFEVLASRWLAIRGITAQPHIDAVVLNGATGPGKRFYSPVTGYDKRYGDGMQMMWLMAHTTPEIPSRYRCRLKTESGRLVFDRMMFVSGTRHFLSREEWSLRISLDVAEWAETL